MDSLRFSSNSDFVLVYSKSSEFVINLETSLSNLDRFRLVDSKGRRYRSRSLMKEGANSHRSDRPTMFFPIRNPCGEEVLPIKPDGSEGRWRWEKATVGKRYLELDWLDKGRGYQPYLRQYAELIEKRPPLTIWFSQVTGNTHVAKDEKKVISGTHTIHHPQARTPS